MPHTILINPWTPLTFLDDSQGYLEGNTDLCFFGYYFWKCETLFVKCKGRNHDKIGRKRRRKGWKTDRDLVWQNAPCWSLRTGIKIKSWSSLTGKKKKKKTSPSPCDALWPQGSQFRDHRRNGPGSLIVQNSN